MRTVKLKDTINPEADGVQPPQQHKTIQLLSDEVHLYWLWTTKTSEQTVQDNRKVDLCLQEFKLESSEDEHKVFAYSCDDRGDAVVVIKKEEPPSSLSSPLPVRRSPTTPTPQKDADGKFWVRLIKVKCLQPTIISRSTGQHWTVSSELVSTGHCS